jgi:dTDP-4-dehydrorhamnose 3,5-epimerase-like enzyme
MRRRWVVGHSREKSRQQLHAHANVGHGFYFFFETGIYTCMNTYSYEHTHIYPISMTISKRLNRLNLEIHEVGD